MTSRIAIVPALLLALGLSGCGLFLGGKTITKFNNSQPPVSYQAPASGSYALMPLFGFNPIVVVQLKEGDPLGFTHAETGQVKAIAGQHEILLDAGKTYYWKQQ